ncbi:hypothetical protein AVDCRST_MAG94-2596, partial [uncultured Leptolyngbya sp.]
CPPLSSFAQATRSHPRVDELLLVGSGGRLTMALNKLWVINRIRYNLLCNIDERII